MSTSVFGEILLHEYLVNNLVICNEVEIIKFTPVYLTMDFWALGSLELKYFPMRKINNRPKGRKMELHVRNKYSLESVDILKRQEKK